MNKKEMTKAEKKELMVLIMRDLRNDWSCDVQRRTGKVLEIAKELKKDSKGEEQKLYCETVKITSELLEYITKNEELVDGRWFRGSVGGYDSYILELESGEFTEVFKDAVEKNCNCPDEAWRNYISGDDHEF